MIYLTIAFRVLEIILIFLGILALIKYLNSPRICMSNKQTHMVSLFCICILSLRTSNLTKPV